MAGPACCSNPPILNSFAGAGHVDKIGGLNAYLTGSLHSTRAILFVSDIYGTLFNSFSLLISPFFIIPALFQIHLLNFFCRI
jgi:type IV secretory pathway VirB6-like protein